MGPLGAAPHAHPHAALAHRRAPSCTWGRQPSIPTQGRCCHRRGDVTTTWRHVPVASCTLRHFWGSSWGRRTGQLPPLPSRIVALPHPPSPLSLLPLPGLLRARRWPQTPWSRGDATEDPTPPLGTASGASWQGTGNVPWDMALQDFPWGSLAPFPSTSPIPNPAAWCPGIPRGCAPCGDPPARPAPRVLGVHGTGIPPAGPWGFLCLGVLQKPSPPCAVGPGHLWSTAGPRSPVDDRRGLHDALGLLQVLLLRAGQEQAQQQHAPAQHPRPVWVRAPLAPLGRAPCPATAVGACRMLAAARPRRPSPPVVNQ